MYEIQQNVQGNWTNIIRTMDGKAMVKFDTEDHARQVIKGCAGMMQPGEFRIQKVA